MKSKYQAPTVEVIEFGDNDFLTSSTDYNPCDPCHGHGHGNGHDDGWGHNNGNHNGNGHNHHGNP